MISGTLLRFPLFLNAEFSILFGFFFWFGQSMVYTAFFLSTLVGKLDKAIQVAFIVILGNVLIMITFIDGPATIMLFYSDKMRAHAYIRFVVHVFEYFPVYNFCVGFGLIAMFAADRFDS